jgi:glycosyltransferase involved in cell wall biosynthesis
MKILHVITTINLGGAENHLFDLIVEQRKQGHDVSVAYLKGDHYWRSRYQDLGVSTHCLEITNYALLFRSFLLTSLMKRWAPDVVHAHMPPAELATRLALLGAWDIPLVISKHNDEPFAPVFKNFFFLNWLARRASAIICISEAVRGYISARLRPSQQTKLEKIYYAVNAEKFEQAPPAQDLQLGSAFVIGTVARLMPQKSLPTLLKAFAQFQKKEPLSKLVIVGIGPLEAELKRLAEELQISKDLIWAGKRSDVPSVMKRFHVFALTSIYEGFGLVLLEAMAAGIPVVASNVSAIPEVLDQGRCGLLFKPQDENELVDCLVEMRSAEKRQSLSANGKERVRTFFSLEKMGRATDQVYRRVAAK